MDVSSKYPKHFASKCKVYMAANQLIAMGGTVVAFDTKQYDPLNEFNIATYRFTALEAGYYLAHLHLIWAFVGAGFNFFSAIRHRTPVGVNIISYGGKQSDGNPSEYSENTIIQYLNAGEGFEFWAWHNVPAGWNVIGTIDDSYINILRVG